MILAKWFFGNSLVDYKGLAGVVAISAAYLLIAANKVDTAAGEALAAPFYELAKEVYPVSAEHGTGVDDFLDAATRDFPVQAEPSALESEGESAANLRDTQIAIIGRPQRRQIQKYHRLDIPSSYSPTLNAIDWCKPI